MPIKTKAGLQPAPEVLHRIFNQPERATFRDVLNGYGLNFINHRVMHSMSGRLVYPVDGGWPRSHVEPLPPGQARLGVWRRLRAVIQEQRDAAANRRFLSKMYADDPDNLSPFNPHRPRAPIDIEDSDLVPIRSGFSDRELSLIHISEPTRP